MIGAVDIGGTKIAVAIVSETGKLCSRLECATEPEKGYADGLGRIQEMLVQAAQAAGSQSGSLGGIGIGCTGRHDVLAGNLGDVGAFLPGWEGAPIADDLKSFFGVGVALENDADTAALGEAAWGAGRDVERFIYITVSTGIGGGMVYQGQLVRGVGGAHPEMGHHVIDPSGPACFCGAHGCWESLASGPAMAHWWFEHLLPELKAASRRLNAGQICAAAEAGDPHAQAAVDREGYYLGLGLANLITLFAPDRIALGGGVMRSRALFWKQMLAVIRQNCGLLPYARVQLVPAAYGTDAVLLGAARAWMLRYQK